MNIYKLLSSKLDYMLFCVGLIYVLTMAYYDTSNKETKSHNEQEIISTHLSNICITDSNNITICNSLEKNIYQVKLEPEGHNLYRLHIVSKD